MWSGDGGDSKRRLQAPSGRELLREAVEKLLELAGRRAAEGEELGEDTALGCRAVNPLNLRESLEARGTRTGNAAPKRRIVRP